MHSKADQHKALLTDCPLPAALEAVGERWSFLILRGAFNGLNHFEEFQSTLGIARNILSNRLARLVEHGILERRRYQERPERHEYRLTAKGLDLYPILVSLMQWGDRYGEHEDGPPLVLRHEGCGAVTEPRLTCGHCGEVLDPREVRPEPGPGALAAA